MMSTQDVASAPISAEFTVFGHRGARGHAPENTLLAIHTGIRLGAPWVEFDVQLHAASGELLVFHDLTLDRTTNGRGLLADHSLESLRVLDAGLGQPTPQQIPTLQEVLDLVDQQAGVNIELKTGAGTADAVAAVLRQYLDAGWPVEKLLVSSFHLPELWEFKQIAPEIPVAALVAGVPLDWAGAAIELEAVALNIASDFVDPRLIADAHGHGIKVNVYTVNNPDEMRALRAMGVDGVFTDYPERALGIA
jgi:glycerophosphoryl diester phosphodiesterase